MKKTWVRKTLGVGVLAAGALLLAPAAMAQAEVDQATSGSVETHNDTQVDIPATVPVNLIGDSDGFPDKPQGLGLDADEIDSGPDGSMIRRTSFRNRDAQSRTQVSVPITVPVDVSGGADEINTTASSTGLFPDRIAGTPVTEYSWGGGDADQVIFGSYGTLNGTHVSVPVTIPVDACGSSLALIGAADPLGACADQIVPSFARKASYLMDRRGKKAARWIADGPSVWPAAVTHQAAWGSYGALYDEPFVTPIAVPVNACGNSLGLLGYASGFGGCDSHLGVAYRRPVQWVKPLVPVYPDYAPVDDCDDWIDPVYVKGDCGDDGYVRGYPGGYDDGDVKNGKGGYAHGGGRGNDVYPVGDTDEYLLDDAGDYPVDEYPAVDDDGYVGPNKYGNKGGRGAEGYPVATLIHDFGGFGFGGLDLLNTLR